MTTEGRLWCCSCLDWLPAEEFRDEVVGKCRKCVSAAAREWREMHPDAVREYNEQRRREYREAHPLPTRPCVVCGESFSKRPDAILCSEACREERKRQQRLERKAA
jgi:Uncharacterized protein containing a Zn-ribbon (DUF2116)